MSGIRGQGRGRGRGRPTQNSQRSANNIQPSPAFNKTLQFITTIKLQELEKQRLAYQTHAKILQEAKDAKSELARVELLLDAVRSWSGPGAVGSSGVVGSNLQPSNLDLWILQAKSDPSFDPNIVKGWGDILETHIRHSLLKFDYAKLFGKFLNEWLSSGDSSIAASLTGDGPSGGDTGEDTAEPFVVTGRKELFEQKERFSSIIFEPKHIDTAALASYLTDLFSEEDAAKELEGMRKRVKDFSELLQQKPITAADLQDAIKDILASALMNEESRTTLREFAGNPTVLDEVANVLTMRLASLETWSWPSTGVAIEMRRHLNGKYRAFTDPEILDAIFLHYLGVAWQVQFKAMFRDLVQSQVWKSSLPRLSTAEREHRQRFFQERKKLTCGIEDARKSMREDQLFLCQLSDNAGSAPTYDDLLDTDDSEPSSKSPAAIKKKLLHLIVTESHLNKTIHGSHAIIRSDFEWFGPSLSHDLILTTLSFFGVPEQWLKFFKTFLRAPLRFKEDISGEIRTRECGTPISYSLSVFCGELVLFCMDFAVNQNAGGLFLYRMHDDLWLWNSSPEKVAAGWREMNEFASLAGLKFNMAKTGSACINEMSNPDLPSGDVRWGFLKFESGSGRFVIDQEDVDREITELRRQLASTRSVFGWVNAYNKYMDYFVRNFGGRPARCFGQAHVNDMVDTLARIQRELFPSSDGGVVGHLRSMIGGRFGVDDLPQGCFYFPIGSGGLELRNPLIELLSLRKEAFEEPEEEFKTKMELDATTYRSLKDTWLDKKKGDDSSMREFPTFEEYVAGRETSISHWQTSYNLLLSESYRMPVGRTPALRAALQNVNLQNTAWEDMGYYRKWITALYGDELVDKFGSLEIVDPTLIPVGMVQLFRTSRMKLDQ